MKQTKSNGISTIHRSTVQGPPLGRDPLMMGSKASEPIVKSFTRNFNANAPLFVPSKEHVSTRSGPDATRGHSSLVYYLELLNLPVSATRSDLEELVKGLCFEITKNNVTCFEVVDFGTFDLSTTNGTTLEKGRSLAKFAGEAEQGSDIQTFATVGVTRWDVSSSLLWTLDGYEWEGQVINAQMGAPRDGVMPGEGGVNQDHHKRDHLATNTNPISHTRNALGTISGKRLELCKLTLSMTTPPNAYSGSSGCVASPFDMHYPLPMGMSPLYFGCNPGYRGMYPSGFHISSPQSKRQTFTKDARSNRAPRRLSALPAKDNERALTSSDDLGRSASAGEHAESREDSFIVIESEDGLGPIKVDPCRLFVGNVPFRLTWVGLRSFLVEQSAKNDPEGAISIERVKIPMQQLVYNCYGQMLGNGFDLLTRDMYMRDVRPGWDAESIQAMLALTPLYNLSKSKGYAIVQTGDAALAKKLIDMFDNVEFEGRSLTVRYDRFPLIDCYVLQQVSAGMRRPLSVRGGSDIREGKKGADTKDERWRSDTKEVKKGADDKDGGWGVPVKDGRRGTDITEGRRDTDTMEGRRGTDIKEGKWAVDIKNNSQGPENKEATWSIDKKDSKWGSDIKDGPWEADMPDMNIVVKGDDLTWGANTKDNHQWGTNMVQVQVKALPAKFEDKNKGRSNENSDIITLGAKKSSDDITGESIGIDEVKANAEMGATTLAEMTAKRTQCATRKNALAAEWTLVEKRVRDRGSK